MAGFPTALSRSNIRATLNSPQTLAFIPALTLGGYWLGGESTLLILALLLPAVLAFVGYGATTQTNQQTALDGMGQRESIENALEQFALSCANSGRATAAVMVEIDDYNGLISRLGHKACNEILNHTVQKMHTALRDMDVVSRLDGATFAIAIAPVKRADLEALIQISARLQAVISEPISLDATTVYVSSSIGFCLGARAPSFTGESMLASAEHALADARQNGPNAIRSYSPEMQRRARIHHDLIEEVSLALENGEIIPWFQPQVSTDTGEVTGFEALARWDHPERGMISPGEFLPAIEGAGLFERLGEVILYQSLSSMVKWQGKWLSCSKSWGKFFRGRAAQPEPC